MRVLILASGPEESAKQREMELVITGPGQGSAPREGGPEDEHFG